MHVEDVVGEDKSLDVVVEIFNRVNSGGTKLSRGDLALAKRAIDISLNMIDGHLGFDHDRVLFGRFAIPVMVRYLDQRSGPPSARERDKLLFWFVQAGMWGRFSEATETYIDQDLAAVDSVDSPLDKLVEQLRLWHGGLRTEPGNFTGWSLGARFYPILYMLTRMGGAQDWGTGDPLKKGMLGKMNQLEVHQIFPKSRLYQHGYHRPEVNALANFCFLTKDTNLQVGNRFPSDYFPEVEFKRAGALASQWVPTDPELWKIENYLDFLAERRKLLAAETNRRMENLLRGDTRWFESPAKPEPVPTAVPGGIASEDEEAELDALNEWVQAQRLPPGQMAFDSTGPDTGEQLAVFDLAWPNGGQAELSQPVAVLPSEGVETLAIAAAAGYRCFTSTNTFRTYVATEISPAVGVET